jgi:group I intron endonuclease
MITIYKITSPGVDCYIGRTKDLQQRIKVHRTNRKCTSSILFDKHGFNNCSFNVLEECKEDIASVREQWWIDNTPNIVNVARACKKKVEPKEQIHTVKNKTKRDDPTLYMKSYYENNRQKFRSYYENNKQKENYKKIQHETVLGCFW